MQKTEKYNKLFFFILLSGIILRLSFVSIPILEVLPSAQSEYATVAKNFYQNGFHILKPEFNLITPEFSMLRYELNIYPFLTAILYAIFNDANEWLGRCLSIAFAIGICWILFFFAKQLYDKKTGMLTAFIFFFSPLSIIYTRTFTPDSLGLFFSVLSLFCCYKQIYQNKKKYLYFAALAFTVATLVDSFNAYLLLPMILMGICKEKKISFNLIYLLVFSAVIPVIWWLYSISINTQWNHELISKITSYADSGLLNSISFWRKIGERLVGPTLTPVGFVFLIISLFKKDVPVFLYIWFISTFSLILIFPNFALQNKAILLPLLCVSSILIAKEIGKLHLGLTKKPSRIFLFFIKTVTFITIPTQISTAYALPESYRFVYEAGQELQRFADKDDKIIANRELYYCNRKGWILDISNEASDDIAINLFESYKNAGAKYLIISEIENYRSHKKFLNYILDNCEEVVVDYGYRIYKMKQPKLKDILSISTEIS